MDGTRFSHVADSRRAGAEAAAHPVLQPGTTGRGWASCRTIA